MFQVVFGRDSDVPQECARHFREGAFDQVEPRTMLGRMNILEAPGAAAEIGHGLLRDMGRVVVQYHTDDGILGVVRVELFEQTDELDATVAGCSRTGGF